MITRKLSDIARMAEGSVPDLFGEVEIKGVALHPEEVRPGCLYIPLSEDQGDKLELAEEAVRRGAAAMLRQAGHIEEYPGQIPSICVEDAKTALLKLAAAYRKELPARAIAVTGSDGKSTTRDVLATMLATTYKTFQTEGGVDHPLSDLACAILRMDESMEMAVFELQWNEQEDLAEQAGFIRAEAAIITNVGETQLKVLGSRREVAAATMKVAEGLLPGSLLVYNGEEPLLGEMLASANKPDGLLTYRFGSSDTCDIYPIAIMNELEGTCFKTNLPTASYFRVPLLGLHNIMNALAAAALSKYMGVCDQDAVTGMNSLERSYSRLVPMYTRSGAVIFNDSLSATPTSMKAAIELLKELSGYERKIVVLGDMTDLGPDEVRYHKEIGAMLTAPEIYKVFAYGTLARHIASEAGKGQPPGRVKWFQEKAELIDAVAAEADNKDAILVKGSKMLGLDELVEVLTGV